MNFDLKISKKKINIIFFITLLISFFFITTYSIIIFFNISAYKIIFCSFTFLILFLLLLKISKKELFKIDLNLNFTEYTIILINLLLLLLLFILPSNLRFYYTLYPTLFADLKLPVFHDVTFHVSLINSIINFGYPGTGLHDIHFLFYHFLSHYLDALILKIANLDPLDSYALFFFFKFFILLNCILLFINKNIHGLTFKKYLFCIIFFLPSILYNYEIFVGSAFITAFIITLVFFENLFEFVKKKVSHLDLLKINFIIILIYFSKSSNGITAFLLIYLLLYKENFLNKINYKYLFHFFFLLFVIIFFSFRLSKNDGVVTFNFSEITNLYITEILILFKILVIFIINKFFLKKFSFFPFFFSAIIIFLLKIIIASTYYSFFLMSFDFLFNLFFFKIIINVLLNKNSLSNNKLLKKIKIISISTNFIINNLLSAILVFYFFLKKQDKKNANRLNFLVIIITMSTLYNSNKITYFNDFNFNKFYSIFVYYNNYPTQTVFIDKDVFSKKSFITNYEKLEIINDWVGLPKLQLNDKIINKQERLSVFKLLKMNKFEKENLFKNYNKPMHDLKKNLSIFISENNLKRNQLLLFFPKEIFLNYFFINYHHLGEKLYFSNFLYALTGVPLINGVFTNKVSNEGSYNFSLYKNDSLLKNYNSFIEEFVCKNKDVIIINDINFKDFSLIKCIN